MATRLIIVSNRVALPDTRQHARGRAGGRRQGRAARSRRRLVRLERRHQRRRRGARRAASSAAGSTTPSSTSPKADYQEYYNGFANRVLWPILHYRVDLQEYSRADQSGYMRVNSLFADQLDAIIEDDDVVWVHDYHLMPLARELRARGRVNPIGFFLHIPCAPPDILTTLPNHEEILGSLVHYDLVGFQTDNDRDNFAHYLTSLGAKPGRADSFTLDGRQTRIGAFPVGIETAVYAAARAQRRALARSCGSCVDSLTGQTLVLGVDRLDYSKGIIHRLNAFDRFLEVNPGMAVARHLPAGRRRRAAARSANTRKSRAT